MRPWKLQNKEAKEQIKNILGDQVRFEGHFEIVFDQLKESRQKQLIQWIIDCREGKNMPISSDKINELLAFILKFRETNFRAILTKKKNEYFIAVFLDKHKYYENQRMKLGI